MKAICVVCEANSRRLIEQEVPRPEPGSGELLVQVYAAGVTPTELDWYPTLHTKTGATRRRPVPGHEFSGVLASIGADVNEFHIGDSIYGMNDWFQDGAMAEYCIAKPGWVALKPAHLTHAEAASVPMGALTAWQGLFDIANLQANERVLVQGGAGAVGVYAVQLAHSRGAYVATTAAANKLNFVRELGADEVFDYKADYFDGKAGSFDVIFDVVGGETLEKSWSLLKPNGRMVTIASQSADAIDEREKRAFFIVEPNHQRLQEISELLTGGALKTVVDTIVPLAMAADAYTGRLAGKQGRGKVVVEVTTSGKDPAI